MSAGPKLEASQADAGEPDVAAALDYARQRLVGVGDAAAARAYEHALGTVAILEELGVDAAARTAGALFGAPERLPLSQIEAEFGPEVRRLVDGMRVLRKLREIHRQVGEDPQQRASAVETLRRMMLAMALDVRVVLIRLASRLQTLRRHARD
ncbi:MAG: HD domain-containing protein, partial [Burkholderiaceae bacterium]